MAGSAGCVKAAPFQSGPVAGLVVRRITSPLAAIPARYPSVVPVIELSALMKLPLAGQVLFEIGGVDEDTAKSALRRVSHKMPVRCRLIARAHGVAR